MGSVVHIRGRERTEEDISKHVHTIPSHLTHVITGDTWSFRDEIKHHGGLWDKWTRRWYIDADGLSKLIDDLEEKRAQEYAGGGVI